MGQGIGATNLRLGGNAGVGGLQQGINGQSGNNNIAQQLKELFQKLLQGTQGGGKSQGAGQAQSAQNGGTDNANGLDDTFRKIQELAQQNPALFAQMLKQNPQVAGVLQAAMSGGGGGGSVGGIRH